MDFKVEMRTVGVGTLIGKGRVTINDVITIDNVRLMKYTAKDGTEKAFVSMPQKKVIIDGQEKYQDIVNISSREDREHLLFAAQNAVKEDLLASLDEKVEVTNIKIMEKSEQEKTSALKAFVDIRIGEALDIKGLQIYQYKNDFRNIYVSMPKIKGDKTWEEFITFNNNFTYNDISNVVIKSYREEIEATMHPEKSEQEKTNAKIESVANKIVASKYVDSADDKLKDAEYHNAVKALTTNPKKLLELYEQEQKLLFNSMESPRLSPEERTAKQAAYDSLAEISIEIERIIPKSINKKRLK